MNALCLEVAEAEEEEVEVLTDSGVLATVEILVEALVDVARRADFSVETQISVTKSCEMFERNGCTFRRRAWSLRCIPAGVLFQRVVRILDKQSV